MSHWFQTYTGRRFRPLNPQPHDVAIEDIARSLALQVRFNGHLRFHYSIAQHSILVSENVPPAIALEGLLHDAAEAYVGDMVRPLKIDLLEFQEAERRVEEVIARVFKLRYPWPTEVKAADDAVLATERRDVFPVEVDGWMLRAEPLPAKIVQKSPLLVEGLFLARFRELERVW